MKNSKALLILIYLSLFFYWLIINLHQLRSGTFPPLLTPSIGIYALVFGMFFGINALISVFKIPVQARAHSLSFTAVTLSLAVCVIGIGVLVRAIIYEGPLTVSDFPCLAGILFMSLGPLLSFSFLALFRVQKLVVMWLIFNLCLIFLSFLGFHALGVSHFDTGLFLINYLPLSILGTCVLLLMLVYLAKKKLVELVSLLALFWGTVLWFFAYVFYFALLLQPEQPQIDYLHFFLLTSVFLFLLGIVGLRDLQNIGDMSGEELCPTMFRTVKFKVPTSLN